MTSSDLPSPSVDRIDGYKLIVMYQKGDKREKGVTCESEFMEQTMPEVGKAIRKSYRWVPKSKPIFCILTMWEGTERIQSRQSMSAC